MSNEPVDYFILRVGYSRTKHRITRVQVVTELASLSNHEEMTRQQVVDKLQQDCTFMTTIPWTSGQYHPGAKVNIYHRGDEEYISTEKNDREEDNFENVAEFD